MSDEHLSVARDFRIKAIGAFYGWHEKLVAISTTLLAVSVTFREKLAGPVPQYSWLLNITWIALALCVVSGLLVQRGQPALFDQMADVFDAATSEEIDRIMPKSSHLLTLGKNCTWLSFSIAVAALTAFGVLNNL